MAIHRGKSESQLIRLVEQLALLVALQVYAVERFSQTAIGLDPPVPKLSLDPFTQLLHHRAAMFPVILEPLLIAHPLRLVVVLVDFPNRLHYLSALDGEDL